MKRPNKETIIIEYNKFGPTEISNVLKQYSRQQDEYIDYLEAKLESTIDQLHHALTR